MISNSYPYQEKNDNTEEGSTRETWMDLPIVLSSLNDEGKWDILPDQNPISLQGVSFINRGYYESSVYAITNRSNIDLTAVLFTNKKEITQLVMVDYFSTLKSKILSLFCYSIILRVIPPHSTRYFTIIISDLNENACETTGFFRLIFSNLRKFSYSFQYHLSWCNDPFIIRGNHDHSSPVSIQIEENKTSTYSIVNTPRLFVGTVGGE